MRVMLETLELELDEFAIRFDADVYFKDAGDVSMPNGVEAYRVAISSTEIQFYQFESDGWMHIDIPTTSKLLDKIMDLAKQTAKDKL